MAYDWHRILAGPRGRLLCLMYACASEHEHEHDKDASPSLSQANFDYYFGHFGQGARPYLRFRHRWIPFFWRKGRYEHPHVSDGDLLDRLAAVIVRPVAAESLPGLLEEVVNDAQYWDTPRSREQLLATDRARELLLPWARLLADDPHVQWWTEGLCRQEQYAVHTPNRPLPPMDRPMSELLLEERADELAGDRSPGRPGSNAWQHCGGAWWATPESALSTTRRWPSPRPSWTYEGPTEPVRDPLAATLTEDAGFQPWEASWDEVTVLENARVLEIRDADDWAGLCRSFPMVLAHARRSEWWRCTGRDGAWVVPDWAAVAELWDGIHLPVASYLELAGRVIPLDEGLATMLAAWSPDVTYWLTDL